MTTRWLLTFGEQHTEPWMVTLRANLVKVGVVVDDAEVDEPDAIVPSIATAPIATHPATKPVAPAPNPLAGMPSTAPYPFLEHAGSTVKAGKFPPSFKAADKELRGVWWLANQEPTMPGVWKTRFPSDRSGTWYRIEQREDLKRAIAASMGFTLAKTPATEAAAIKAKVRAKA